MDIIITTIISTIVSSSITLKIATKKINILENRITEIKNTQSNIGPSISGNYISGTSGNATAIGVNTYQAPIN